MPARRWARDRARSCRPQSVRSRADRPRASPVARRFGGWLRRPGGRRSHRQTPCAASMPIRGSRSAACGARGRRSTRTRPSPCWLPPLPSGRARPARRGAPDRAPACSAVRPKSAAARYSSSKFTGALKWNSSTPSGAPLTRSGSAAADANPLSAASVADRQYFS